VTEVKFFPLSGGMDVVTPAISVPAGRVISGKNYESSPRGYKRIDGWERFDGRPKPSSATYQVVTFDNGSYIPQPGNVITGLSSGKTAKVIYEASIYSGFIVDGTAVGAFPVIENTGILSGEFIAFGSIPIGRVSSSVLDSSPTTPTEERNWIIAASDDARTKIGVVPGSGPVRGVWTYNGDVYAFRDNAGGTAGVMYKATAAGWQSLSFHSVLNFDIGTVVFAIGDVITGGTSLAKGTILSIALQDGDWTTDDASGYFVVSPITGQPFVFQNNEIITSPGGGSATVNGVISPITLPPGGRYHFDNHNFKGTTGSLKMYGVNGVGPAFEFDGTTLTPIITGELDDTPIRVVAHSDHLFLGYRNGRVMHSAIFNPLNYEVIQGALLAGIGDEITDMVPTATGDLAIFGRNKVAVLYGKNTENWNLMQLTNESGAIPWTAQLIGSPLYLDQIGIRSLDTTQAYGNFALGTKTQLIEPKITEKLNGGITAVGSLRIRKKDTYRLFWSDGTGIAVYFGRKQPESMIFDLGFAPTCTCSGEDVSGREILFIGSDSGYVYQMDAGTSADGDSILAYVRLPFNHVGSPAYDKRWHKAIIEVDASPQTKISVTYACSYGDTDLPQPSEQDFSLHGGGGFWDEALWDAFHWDSPVEGTAKVDLEGIGQNLSLVIISDEVYPLPHTIHGVTLHFNYRRLVR
jgi:hypothetical protein